MMTCSIPLAIASSTPYWIVGLSTRGSISLGCALVTGRKRVPRPAAGNIALLTARGDIETMYDETRLDGITQGWCGRPPGPLAPQRQPQLNLAEAGVVDDHLGPPQ